MRGNIPCNNKQYIFEKISTNNNFNNSIFPVCIGRLLKPPQGILGGIGRRVSSFLWSGISTGVGTESVRQINITMINIGVIPNTLFPFISDFILDR